MKLTLKLVYLFGIIKLTIEQGTPIYVKSLQNLHRGPLVPTNVNNTDMVKISWILQKLDNFDATNYNTWYMRYMENVLYFEEGGPMIIYFGGEWTIEKDHIRWGILADIAKEHKGILFYTEHRFYGESIPTSDLSLESLKYLKAEQSLADVAYFIRYQRKTNPLLLYSKVFTCGCSYSATMVVWFNKLYPELVNGGWASSAPLLAKVDYMEYKEIMGKAFKELGSPQCHDRIKNGISELEAMFEDARSDEAKTILQLCKNFDHNNELDVWTLFDTISNVFAAKVQNQKGTEIDSYCSYLMDFEDDVTAVVKFFLKHIDATTECLDLTYDRSKTYYLNDYNNLQNRPWFYQTCNELGWFQTSTSKNQPFGTKFPADLYITMCKDVLGHKYTNETIHDLIERTNENFGGLNIEVPTVYMTHGGSDPWSPLGHNEDQGATVIPLASHCQDFGSISDSDSNEMRASKERLFEFVRQMLA